MDAPRRRAASVSGACRLRSGALNKLIRTADEIVSVRVWSMDVPARKVKVKWKADGLASGGEWWVTASVRNGVMHGTRECKCTQCEPIEDDVKHGMGREGEWAGGRREDCALRVVVHGRCRKRARVCSSIVACVAERQEDGVASWVVSSQDLRLNTGIATADWRDNTAMFIV
ncbi:uncharacterized protein FOMMEDRAFT_154423 [Fomitiporia mediterranea MF3/22]|uniref:uncharacterized protein n=1 Tax=Fomitiporia mediterranea (strain MF3/22) TaxID=694068 RepID=UPI00044090CB|nr:uncharacterized protein FOMMEDRAFT_154423 [Fomitiporia mediterranea MF3/22]EJD05208.1 hypothetical protein FOMMEDRAFT_154423 [Fomitiporia mediterranea MF3/22]